MKTLSFILFFTVLVSSAFANNAKTSLEGVQGRIDGAFGQMIQSGDASALDQIIEELANAKSPAGSHWADYWTAYAYSQKAVYYAYINPDQDQAMAAINAGKKIIIDHGSDRTSDDFALLSNLQMMSLQYVQGMEIMQESQAAEDWADQAIKLDENNPRAHYMAGMFDFYKPAQFGGGRKAQGILKTATEKYATQLPNPVTPTWGHAEAISLYGQAVAKDDPAKALSIIEAGLAKFPEHQDLQRVKGELSQQ